MFFCEKCRNLYNVTKEVKSKQIGGKINNALNNIFNKLRNLCLNLLEEGGKNFLKCYTFLP